MNGLATALDTAAVRCSTVKKRSVTAPSPAYRHTASFYQKQICEKLLTVPGGYGDFDFCAEKASMEIKKAFPDREIKRFYITPYIDDSHRERLNDMEKRFDGTIYPPLETVPLKYAISKRNEWMIDQADMVVSGVTHDWGGAAKTLKYAERKKKRVISI